MDMRLKAPILARLKALSEINYKGNNVSPILSGLITSLQVKPRFWSERSLKQSCHLLCGLNHVNQVILEQDKQSKENAFYHSMPSILFVFFLTCYFAP